MTEQFLVNADAFRLPAQAVDRLKQEGMISHATLPQQAVLRYAVCPFAQEEQFYATRAQSCTGFSSGTVSPIVRRYVTNEVLQNPTTQTSEQGSAPRILYEVNSQVREILTGTKPLPGCTKK
ncbi:MAG TPA: hypothetical protein VE090_03345 [Methylomirabilota bacterium]|nr:hypothetical protein [Methylomirabilota bacterium]